MDVFGFRERPEQGADEETEALAREVIGAAIEVHRTLGPGFPESTYRRAVSRELDLRAIRHSCEFRVPVFYKGVRVGRGKVDILVCDKLVVELKTVVVLTEVHRAQVIAYLQAIHNRLGLLINFNVALLKDGLKRVINTQLIP
jgi:GxxExxY protein